MAKRTKSELKNFFQAGKRPTESQFEDFIDSYAHLDDTRIRELNNSEYTVNLQFPADYQVGDYVEFVGFHPEMASASGFYEISVAYTRDSIASAATHIASVSHSNPNIWRECGRINTNNYVGYANGDCFTIDTHGSLYRFRIRATRILGDPASDMYVAIKVRSINKNLSWNEMDNRGNDSSTIPLQPMTDQWELLVGSAFSADSAKVALKVIQNGNVGVGTKLPYSKLQVVSPFSTAQEPGAFIIGDVNYPNLRMGHNEQYTWIQSHSGAPLHINPLGNNIIFNKDAGNVGIGIENPQTKLDVNGFVTSRITDSAINSSNTSGFIVNQLGLNVLEMSYTRDGQGVGMIKTPLDNHIAIGTNNTERIRVHGSTGNVGIGTQNPDQKLTVKGKIHAEDVIVDMNVPADYVFQKYYDNYSSIREDYSMMNLNELEAFIKENKRLPEIPSGEKMTQDGVTLGDFQMKLLQKIEELTLYAISQNKEIEQLKSQINKQ